MEQQASSQAAPVLLLAFNRPSHTQRVIEAIKAYAPARLYVVCDGPRKDVPQEAERVRQVHEVVTQTVDWPCMLRTRYRKENLGCARGVIDGISWFFEREERGIILEDDCLPARTFFQFCNELLDIYSEDTRIWTISGDNFLLDEGRGSASYRISRYFHCWGWATWRRSWVRFPKDPDQVYRNFLDGESSPEIGEQRLIRHFWHGIADLCILRDIDSWDYAFMMFSLLEGGLHAHPSVNLVRNIGFGEGATHTKGDSPKFDLKEMTFPVIHPKRLAADSAYDKVVERERFHVTLRHVLKLKLRAFRIRLGHHLPFRSHDQTS
jgi:hypothetical protein